jgi:hypothetical protein
MTLLGGNVYNSTIPGFPAGTKMTYIIMAIDNAGNVATSTEIGYQVQNPIPEFPTFVILPLFLIATLLAATVCQSKHVNSGKTRA